MFATPGTCEALNQNCRVPGPRITDDAVTFPRAIRCRSVSSENPGRNGAASSRIAHGPIAFCEAWRDSGSSSPLQCGHCVTVPTSSPQYGQTAIRGWGTGNPGCRGLAAASALCPLIGIAASVGMMNDRNLNKPVPRTTTAACEFTLCPMTCSSINLYESRAPRFLARFPRACLGSWRSALRCSLLTVLLTLAGCSSGNSAAIRSESPFAGVDRTAAQTRAGANASRDASASRPSAESPHVALIGGEPITLAELLPALEEAAGGMILEEAALDRLVARELASRSRGITDADIRAERAILAQTLQRGITSSEDQTTDVVERLRTTRGLGDARFAALLRRNAGLRELVRADVTVSEVDLEIAYQIRYGVRYQTRLILVRSELDAAAARSRLLGRDGKPPEAFSSVASQLSIDPSSARGGTIGLVSPVDPSYPEAVRRVVASLGVGAISETIAIDQGFAILTVERVVPAESGVTPASVAAELEREVRLVREQNEMARLASRLLGSISVTPLDASLNWGWKAWRSENRQ